MGETMFAKCFDNGLVYWNLAKESVICCRHPLWLQIYFRVSTLLANSEVKDWLKLSTNFPSIRFTTYTYTHLSSNRVREVSSYIHRSHLTILVGCVWGNCWEKRFKSQFFFGISNKPQIHSLFCLFELFPSKTFSSNTNPKIVNVREVVI